MPPTEQTALVDPLLIDGQDSRYASNGGATMPKAKPNTPAVEYKKDVVYDGDNHMAVLVQMHGSVWPEVAPFCVAALLWTLAVSLLRNHNIIDLTISNNNGHTFMSILVSFLVVTRASITYSRFMEARQYLADLFRSSREVVHYTCLLTNQDKNEKAIQWRQDVAYRTIVALRVAIAAVEFRSHGVNAWETLEEEDHEHMELFLPSTDSPSSDLRREFKREASGTGSTSARDLSSQRELSESARQYKPKTQHNKFLEQLRHGPRSLMDENLRAPIVWVYNLREKLLEHRKAQILTSHPPHVNEDLRWLALSSDWMKAFHGLKMLLTTPFPFPFVQVCSLYFVIAMMIMNENLTCQLDDKNVYFRVGIFASYGLGRRQ